MAAEGIPLLDIRVSSPLSTFQDTVDYVLAVSDCSTVRRVDVQFEDEVGSYIPTDAQRADISSLACSFPFTLSGDQRTNPSVEVHSVDGSSVSYSESFAVEPNQPDLTFGSVGIEEIEGRQYVILQVEARDDIDLAYLSVAMTGLRASDLRSAGGVVEKAKESAFLDSTLPLRIYPREDGQDVFQISHPLLKNLSREEIARNALILMEIMAVDSSGNQRSLSEIRYMGSSVIEGVNDFSAMPTQLIFSDILQSARIIPSLDYEFRGLTAIPGLGHGVQYDSTDTTLVMVTQEGIVYPLQETGQTSVSIQLNYPDQTEISIPVTVDFTRTLTALKYTGSEHGSFELPNLNEFFPLPEIIAVFDDGSEATINESVKLSYQLPPEAAGILEFDEEKGLRASSVLDALTPINLSLSLAVDHSVVLEMPITSVDAPPSIELSVPGSVVVDETLVVAATVDDDVAADYVEFFVNGSLVGRRSSPPYEIHLPISQAMEGSELVIRATAYDSAGQSQSSEEQLVKVNAKQKLTAPEFEMEKPVDSQRVVEGTAIRITVASLLGTLPDPDILYSSGIRYVEFLVEGTKVGESYYPHMETRKNEDNKEDLYEVWEYQWTAPEISTRETSISINVRVYANNGATEEGRAKLVRVIENEQPIVRITSPQPGALATVGQTLAVTLQGADDTLTAGSELSLLLNNETVESRIILDRVNKDRDAFTYEVQDETFEMQVLEEWVGSTLEFRGKLVDYHQKVSMSEPLEIQVKSDQPPTIALSHPVEGQHLVSGLSVEIRANASDDLGIKQVEFFVNDNLVGTDVQPPYAQLYETPDSITGELPLTLHAEVVDSAGQRSVSNPVQATLGLDQQPPVINLASPSISVAHAGDDIAPIVENSQFVLKVTGFDDVGVKELTLTGIGRGADGGFILTGLESDVLSGEDFAPQAIPGALNAFSALKLVAAPPFNRYVGVAYDRYPVTVVASDKTGNSSELEVIIGVYADQSPTIRALTPNKHKFYSIEELRLDVVARDDRFVAAVKVDLYLDSGATPIASIVRDGDDFAPTPELVDRLSVDLAGLSLSNSDHDLRLEVVVTDDQGQDSTPSILDLNIIGDVEGPRAAITSPIQGTTLYSGTSVGFQLRAVDEVSVQSLQVYRVNSVNDVTGTSIHSWSDSGENPTTIETDFNNYTIPAGVTELILRIVAIDHYGNTSPATHWHFNVAQDDPPQISIRTPAPGSRLVEGEYLGVNVLATDDRELTQVQLLMRDGDVETVLKTISDATLQEAVAKGGYINFGLRVPTKTADAVEPDGPTQPAVLVRAVDSANPNQSTEADLELQIIDDLETPLMSISEPSQAVSIFPGQSLSLKGVASDNHYINLVEAFLGLTAIQIST